MGSRYMYDPALALSYTAAQAYCSTTYGGPRPASAHLAYPATQREQEALLAWLAVLPAATALRNQYDSTRSLVASSSTAAKCYSAGQ
jgi:hypothetical protein